MINLLHTFIILKIFDKWDFNKLLRLSIFQFLSNKYKIMASGGVCDARCQAFYTTMIKKEEAKRIKWFLKHQQQLLSRVEKTKTDAEEKLPSKTQKKLADEVIHLKLLPKWRPLESDGSINIDMMKPIEPQVRNILYEYESTIINSENYFNKRIKKLPEERYYYPECTSWIYGWRLSDYSPIPRNKVGRKYVMMNEFYHPRISSLQRDPDWYRPCQRTPVKCDDNVML